MIENKQAAPARVRSLMAAVTFWMAVLVVVGAIGRLWLMPVNHPAQESVTLWGVLAFPVALGLGWQRTRARNHQRLQSAMDVYGEQELMRTASAVKSLPRARSRSEEAPSAGSLSMASAWGSRT